MSQTKNIFLHGLVLVFWGLSCSRTKPPIEEYVDNDGDGYSFDDGDCNDNNSSTYPGAAENESSTDCLTDADEDGWSEEFGDCNDDNDQMPNNDQDCDGVATIEDCDDSNRLIGPPCDEVFVYGTIAGQEGWSEMTNGGAQPDSFPVGTQVQNDEDTRGDSIVGVQLPEQSSGSNGQQAWWFKRGYDSPGSGTPYSPSLIPSSSNQGFRYHISFKAVDELGDGSQIAVIAGDPNGVDRASNFLKIENNVGNLRIITYLEDYEVLAESLDTTVWHSIEAEMTRYEDLDYWTYWVDGEEIISDHIGFFSQYRIDSGFPYTESVRLKFHPTHPNWNADYQGFIFDDLVTQTFDSVTGMVEDSYFTGFE